MHRTWKQACDYESTCRPGVWWRLFSAVTSGVTSIPFPRAPEPSLGLRSVCSIRALGTKIKIFFAGWSQALRQEGWGHPLD